MAHSRQHSFTGTTDHDFTGLLTGELLSFDGTNIVSTTVASTTASNGLTKTGNNIVLGGTLTGNTLIEADGNSLTFSGISNFDLQNTSSVIFNNTSNIDFKIQRSGTNLFQFGASSAFNANLVIGNGVSDASAALNIHSTTKGVLIPRMTKVDVTGITTPATSLMVYQTTETPGFYYYDGADWVRFSDSAESTTASNGLTLGGGNVTLGGALTGDTYIDNAGFLFRANTFSADTMSAQTIHVANLSGFSPININDSMYVEQNGNVGIGTLTADTTLHVLGSMKLEGDVFIVENANSTNQLVFVAEDTVGHPYYTQIGFGPTGQENQINTNAAGGFQLGLGAANRLRFSSTAVSNVKMMLNGSLTGFDFTTNIGQTVHSFTSLGANAGKVVLNNLAVSTGDVQIKGDTDFNLLYTDASTDRVGVGTATPSAKIQVIGNRADSAGDTLLLQNSGGTTTMVVEDGGNVGVGTAAPTSKFHVVGNTDVTGGGAIMSGGTDLYNIFSTGADLTTASNGLTRTGENITLGGTLTGATVIQAAGSPLTFSGLSHFYLHNVGTITFNDTANIAFYIQRSGINCFTFGASSPYNANLTIGTDVFPSSTQESVMLTQGRGITVPSLTTAKETALPIIANRESLFLHNSDLNRFRGYNGAEYQNFAYIFAASSAFTASVALTVTHNLGSEDVNVQLKNSSGELIIPDVVNNYQTNSVDIEVSSTDTFRVIITG